MNNRPSDEPFPQRRRTKLPDYDYASQGAYFITVCIYEKCNLLGNIIGGSMKLNPFGEIVTSCWKEIPLHYPGVDNDFFIVMPNHVHGIVIFNEPPERAGSKPAPTREHPLSEIIRAFKTFSSRRIN
jgi:putative transposase